MDSHTGKDKMVEATTDSKKKELSDAESTRRMNKLIKRELRLDKLRKKRRPSMAIRKKHPKPHKLPPINLGSLTNYLGFQGKVLEDLTDREIKKLVHGNAIELTVTQEQAKYIAKRLGHNSIYNDEEVQENLP